MNDIDANLAEKLEVSDPDVKEAFHELLRIRARLQLDIAEREATIAHLQAEIARLQAENTRLQSQDRNVPSWKHEIRNPCVLPDQ